MLGEITSAGTKRAKASHTYNRWCSNVPASERKQRFHELTNCFLVVSHCRNEYCGPAGVCVCVCVSHTCGRMHCFSHPTWPYLTVQRVMEMVFEGEKLMRVLSDKGMRKNGGRWRGHRAVGVRPWSPSWQPNLSRMGSCSHLIQDYLEMGIMILPNSMKMH